MVSQSRKPHKTTTTLSNSAPVDELDLDDLRLPSRITSVKRCSREATSGTKPFEPIKSFARDPFRSRLPRSNQLRFLPRSVPSDVAAPDVYQAGTEDGLKGGVAAPRG